MLPLQPLVALLSVASARSLAQHPLQPIQDADLRVPTVYESTIMARRILHLSSTGTLITTFPETSLHATASNIELQHSTHDQFNAFENRPAEMAGSPIGLMEYYADCEPHTGNPTLLAIDIATPYKNYAAGSNISLHVRWWPTQTNTYSSSLFSSFSNEDEDIPTPHTPAALPRFSLHGRLEPISVPDLAKGLIPACFMRAHPDSALWQPGNDIHTSQYMRLVVEHVYWFGGFGDRARIGWLPMEGWRNVTKEEVEECRLPGEKKSSSGKGWAGWREWL